MSQRHPRPLGPDPAQSGRHAQEFSAIDEHIQNGTDCEVRCEDVGEILSSKTERSKRATGGHLDASRPMQLMAAAPLIASSMSVEPARRGNCSCNPVVSIALVGTAFLQHTTEVVSICIASLLPHREGIPYCRSVYPIFLEESCPLRRVECCAESDLVFVDGHSFREWDGC